MRDPYKLNSIEPETPNLIKIEDPPEYDYEDWDLNDPKDLKKYIFTVEKTVRQSIEYSNMIAYLRENLNMNQCSFFANVTNAESRKVRIEIHHEPLSLYDIAEIVTRKRLAYNENMDEELTAKEILIEHYRLHIGLIPLSETAHELAHNRYLFIPTTKLFGNYKKFLELYNPYIMPEQKEYIDNIEEATRYYSDKNYKDLLEQKYVYIDFSGENILPYAEIKRILAERVSLLDSDKKTLKMLYTKVGRDDIKNPNSTT